MMFISGTISNGVEICKIGEHHDIYVFNVRKRKEDVEDTKSTYRNLLHFCIPLMNQQKEKSKN